MTHPSFIDLTKRTFGQLLVMKRAPNDASGNTCWECQCSCGNIVTIVTYSLKNGNTKSCGCLRNKITGNKFRTHGMTGTSEHNIWRNMLTRCTNPDTPAFKNYGGRGITICDEWKNDFMAFYNYIGPRPYPNYTVDRIDNDGNYEPGNVRWATRYEQANNSRNNRRITINGWTLNLCQWARFVGIRYRTLRARLKRKWPPTKAIFQPVRHYK
jgi:hypothetical protein